MMEYGNVTEPDTIRFQRLLPGPVQRVWGYLTDSEKRRQWLASGPMDLRVGGRVVLTWRNSELTSEPTPDEYRAYEGHTMEGKILQLVPLRLLTFSWPEGPGKESEVTFELSLKEGQVLLVLTHRGLETRKDLIGAAGGWQAHLGILEDRLRGVEPRPFWATLEPLESEYEERIPAEVGELVAY